MQKKILVIMIESPQISSGLGTLWGKLASNTDDKNLRFDFFCPNPDICSPFGKSGIEIPGKLYYAINPPLSWFLSVKRNANRGIIRLFWSVLYLPFVIVQKYIISSSEDIYLKWFSEQIEEKLPKILESENYDAIACHVPPFEICQSVLNIATSLNIPYVHIVIQLVLEMTREDLPQRIRIFSKKFSIELVFLLQRKKHISDITLKYLIYIPKK